jgi:hypothetical protein
MKKHSFDSSLKIHGHFTAILRDANTGEILLTKSVDNLVVSVAKNGFAKLIAGESGFTGEINYLAVGTGADTPAANETQLVSELARTAIVGGTLSRTNNVVSMEFYFAPTEANGNIKEVGAFIDATATANSGIMFDRALLDVTKTVTNSLTLIFTATVL